MSRNSPPRESSVAVYVLKGAADAGRGGFDPPESAGRAGGIWPPGGSFTSVASSAADSGHVPFTVCL